MTALHATFAPSLVGLGLFDTMPDQQSDPNWQHHQQQQQQQHHAYYNGMPLLTDQWTPTTQPPNAQQPQQSVYGMAAINRNMYTNETYMPYTTTVSNSNTLLSPGPVYTPSESNWPSDMDVTTTTPNFPSAEESMLPYPQNHLAPADRDPRPSRLAHPSVSPQQQPGEPMSTDHTRPPIGRAKTAPVKGQRANKGTASSNAPGSEDSEEDLVPDDIPDATKTTSTKGRKRQRIPHTAVERRYRENLNAHLERLRQTVPSLASRRPSGNSRPSDAGVSEGARPSKCEILNGAIEHIGMLDRENLALKSECTELRARVDDLQRWYNAALRSGGHYPE